MDTTGYYEILNMICINSQHFLDKNLAINHPRRNSKMLSYKVTIK